MPSRLIVVQDISNTGGRVFVMCGVFGIVAFGITTLGTRGIVTAGTKSIDGI